ncbi:MAG: ABC transporter ATP-binding protein [Chloroflexi bacterium]|nr:ABC transporter ATP-binding protein [Chloroflexota bacterium]
MDQGEWAADQPLLEVIDLHVVRDKRPILRGVNLRVSEGSIHAVLGLNGSGKSTLAYTLIGSVGYKPERGKIWFAGQDITHLSISARGKLGLTLAWQEPARFEGLTVGRYLSLGMPEPDLKRMRAALSAVALDPDTYLNRYVDDALSGGERKRIELAAVYAMKPRLAILDEPDSGIDLMALEDIANLIRRMREEGITVLLISHRDQVVHVADTASLICAGEVLITGAPDRVCERYARCCRACDRAEIVETGTDYERL